MKTLPEMMADIFIQSFADAFKNHNIDPTDKSKPISIVISNRGGTPIEVYRSVYIYVDDWEFSLAIKAQKELYRPYKDSELDACISQNLDILLDRPNHVFITDESAKEFLDEQAAIANE